MSPTLRRRVWLVPLALAIGLASCDASCQRQWADVIEALAFLAMVVIAIAVCFAAVSLVFLVGGIVTSILNVTGPSRRTKTVGLTFGVVNALLGGLMTLGVATNPPREPPVYPDPPPYEEPTYDPSDVVLERERTDPFATPAEPEPPPSAAPPSERGLDHSSLIVQLAVAFGWLSLGIIGIVLAIRARPPGAAPTAPASGAPRRF